MKSGDAIAAAAVAAPAAGVGDEGSDLSRDGARIWRPRRSIGSGDEVIPAFDIALVGPAGNAVIAGTAALL